MKTDGETVQPVLSVSDCIDYINIALDREIVVEGEISRIDVRQGNLGFITINDEQSSLDVFALAFRVRNINELAEGMMVQVYGTPGLYKKSGRFRIDAARIVPSGEGSLRIAYEKLKLKLEQEGLFDESRKRALPRFPERVALVTAEGAQAYKDFVKVLNGRFGGVTVDFYPTKVQGIGAEQQIVQALEAAASRPYDAIVLVRGGGSLEDLQAFNDEQVARTIFALPHPVVVGVGHEGDVSLADLVADLRASTPSNAAELLVPERDRILEELYYIQDAAENTIQNKMNDARELVRRVALLSSQVIEGQRTLIQGHTESVIRSFESQLALQKDRVQALDRMINSLDHKNLLKRGYSITQTKSGTIVSDKNLVKAGEEIITTVKNGTIESRVK